MHSSQALSFTRHRVSFCPGSGLRHAHPYDGWERLSGLPRVVAHGYSQGFAVVASQAALTYIGAHELPAIIRQTGVIKGADQPPSTQGSSGGYVGSGLLSRPPRASWNLVKAGEIGDPARPVTPRLRSIDSRINATSLTRLRGDTIGGSPLHEISYLPSLPAVRSAAIRNGRGCVTPTFTLVWQTGRGAGTQTSKGGPGSRLPDDPPVT